MRVGTSNSKAAPESRSRWPARNPAGCIHDGLFLAGREREVDRLLDLLWRGERGGQSGQNNGCGEGRDDEVFHFQSPGEG